MKDLLAVISVLGFVAVSILCLLAAKFGQEWAAKMMDTILPMVIQCWINNFTIIMFSKYGTTDGSQRKSELIASILKEKMDETPKIGVL